MPCSLCGHTCQPHPASVRDFPCDLDRPWAASREQAWSCYIWFDLIVQRVKTAITMRAAKEQVFLVEADVVWHIKNRYFVRCVFRSAGVTVAERNGLCADMFLLTCLQNIYWSKKSPTTDFINDVLSACFSCVCVSWSRRRPGQCLLPTSSSWLWGWCGPAWPPLSELWRWVLFIHHLH